MTELPYPGLRAFTQEESHLFFGREGCVDEMIRRLAQTRFLAVLGASGSGKSSLVRTGLLSALELGFYARAGARWAIAEMHPGGQPLRNLAAALAEIGGGGESDGNDVEALRALLARGSRSLIEWCAGGALPEGHNLLVLVDQFEELFRYGDYAAREEAEAFVGLLLESAAPEEAPIHIVLTMRSEYLGACALIPGLAEEINAGFYLTPRMSRQECRSAIEGPAAVGGFTIEPALVNQILNDMASFAPWEEERGVAQGQLLSRRADQLPLMQHLLNRLWLRAKAAAGEGPVVLRFTDYDAAGGLAGALDAHGTEVMESLAPEDRGDVETIFRALVSGPDPTNAIRRPCRFDELAAEAKGGRETARRVVEAFRAPDCNFLRPEADVPLADDTLLDISHESLIRQWSALAGWLRDEARAGANWRRLLIGAERREAGEGELLSGLDLASLTAWRDAEHPTLLWAARHGGRYEEAERFLAESREAEAAAKNREMQRATRGRRRLIGGIGVLSALLVAVGVLAASYLTQAQRAEAALQSERQARQHAGAAELRAGVAEGQAKQAETRARDAEVRMRRLGDEANRQVERGEEARRTAEQLERRAGELQSQIATARTSLARAQSDLSRQQDLNRGERNVVDRLSRYCARRNNEPICRAVYGATSGDRR